MRHLVRPIIKDILDLLVDDERLYTSINSDRDRTMCEVRIVGDTGDRNRSRIKSDLTSKEEDQYMVDACQHVFDRFKNEDLNVDCKIYYYIWPYNIHIGNIGKFGRAKLPIIKNIIIVVRHKGNAAAWRR